MKTKVLVSHKLSLVRKKLITTDLQKPAENFKKSISKAGIQVTQLVAKDLIE